MIRPYIILILSLLIDPTTLADSLPDTGDVIWVAFKEVPPGWKRCNGQLLTRADFPNLSALISNNFGGDSTNLALPDLRGRAMIHDGNSAGAGLTHRILGSYGGEEKVSLTIGQMASHNHGLQGFDNPSTTLEPSQHALSQLSNGFSVFAAPNSSLHPLSVTVTGQNEAHNNMPPFLALYCLIAVAVPP